ncbi:MAG: lysine transporter LysE [Chitinophagaceae bacterium]|nr:MAG: lysine transporter LysE [Chitinophagaceae bacterium]
MLDALIKGTTLGLLLAISVGPIVFTVIKQSLNNGLKGGMAFILGIFFSDVFLVICCNFFTQFFKILSNYSTPLGIVGSALLILVGIYFLFLKKVKISAEGDQLLLFNTKDYARMFISGAIMNLLNPGIIVFWFTTATAFISYSLNNRLVIFSVALLIALGADLAKVVLADKLRKKLTPKNIHRINKINGVILIGFGIALLWGLLLYGKAGGH